MFRIVPSYEDAIDANIVEEERSGFGAEVIARGARARDSEGRDYRLPASHLCPH